MPGVREPGGGLARARRVGPALILLAAVVLWAVSPLPIRPVSSTPPATAYVLTQTGPDATILTAVALPSGRRLWSASLVGGQSAGLVVASRLGRAYALTGPPFTLTPVSLSAGTVGRPIGVGSSAWSVALAPDGTTAYVVNAGTGIEVLPGPDGSTITPVNLRTGTAGRPISVGDGPGGIAFAGHGTAWVSHPLSGQLTQVNLAAGRAGPGLAVPSAQRGQDAPGALAVSAGAGLLAVGNLAQDLTFPAPVVDLLDLASHRWRRPITLPGSSNAVNELEFSPGARRVYASAFTRSGLTRTLYIASIATGRVSQASLTGQSVAFALTPDGTTLWVAVGTTNTVLIPVNAATGAAGRAVAHLPGEPAAIGL